MDSANSVYSVGDGISDSSEIFLSSSSLSGTFQPNFLRLQGNGYSTANDSVRFSITNNTLDSIQVVSLFVFDGDGILIAAAPLPVSEPVTRLVSTLMALSTPRSPTPTGAMLVAAMNSSTMTQSTNPMAPVAVLSATSPTANCLAAGGTGVGSFQV